MIIDSFLFFQELDLLEIRLHYLYPVVDKFIIVEARQTFNGEIKEFNFEKNINRYLKYLDKISYYKINDVHYNYNNLIKFLSDSNNKEFKNIGKIIESHDYYDKDNISHLLDTYHRESIKLPLKNQCKKNDIVIFSDLDEIPKINLIYSLKNNSIKEFPIVLIQNEFQFFLNNYSHNNWRGSIISQFNFLEKKSLNLLRRDSHKFYSIINAGYHFTSIGSLKTIKMKINSWAHQEFNHPIILNNIESNIRNGMDIFYRFNRPINKYIDLKDNNLIDDRMKNIILDFEELLIKELKPNLLYKIKYLFFQIIFNFLRAISNPTKLKNKFLNIIKNKNG